MFGVFNFGDDFFSLNHLILAAKLFIYECKFNNTHPSIQVFKAKIKALYHVKKDNIELAEQTKHTIKEMDEMFATCKFTEGVNVLHMRLTLRVSLMNNL